MKDDFVFKVVKRTRVSEDDRPVVKVSNKYLYFTASFFFKYESKFNLRESKYIKMCVDTGKRVIIFDFFKNKILNSYSFSSRGTNTGAVVGARALFTQYPALGLQEGDYAAEVINIPGLGERIGIRLETNEGGKNAN